MSKLEVLFSPVEFEALNRRDLSRTTCVVFDILRATSSIITALANGAAEVMPVSSIDEALARKQQNRAVLLAGERNGVRITSRLTGGVEFDFGNSPREFLEEKVGGRTIVMTTTNGTRALKACRGAKEILAGAFLNLSALASHLRDRAPNDLLLICSGTYEEASYEDLLGAGALADQLWDLFASDEVGDSAQIARNTFVAAKMNLLEAMRYGRNGRRLLAIPELKDDVAYCLERDRFSILGRMDEGAIRKTGRFWNDAGLWR